VLLLRRRRGIRLCFKIIRQLYLANLVCVGDVDTMLSVTDIEVRARFSSLKTSAIELKLKHNLRNDLS